MEHIGWKEDGRPFLKVVPSELMQPLVGVVMSRIDPRRLLTDRPDSVGDFFSVEKRFGMLETVFPGITDDDNYSHEPTGDVFYVAVNDLHAAVVLCKDGRVLTQIATTVEWANAHVNARLKEIELARRAVDTAMAGHGRPTSFPS